MLDDEVDAKGRPLHEVQMNKKTGHVVQTTRSKDGSQIRSKTKDFSDLKGDTDSVDVSNEKADALVKQRTIAYIVMVVFIILFVATLCLVIIFMKIKKN